MGQKSGMPEGGLTPSEPWNVFYEGSFWRHGGREKPGRELPLQKRFSWGEQAWYLPLLYLCGKGLVADFCVQVPAGRIRAYLERWGISAETDGTALTKEQRMQARAENPLSVEMHPTFIVNGTALEYSHGSGLCWNPLFLEGNDLLAGWVMDHYGLDRACGWSIWRCAFSWRSRRRPEIRTLSLRLEAEPTAVPGMCFHADGPGARIPFVHPVTNEEHVLTVRDVEAHCIPMDSFGEMTLGYPTHCTLMTYSVAPDLPDGALQITDCGSGDRTRPKGAASGVSGTLTGAAGIGIIASGRADDSSAGGAGLRCACSALRFEPAEGVEWRMVFSVKTRAGTTVELIPPKAG